MTTLSTPLRTRLRPRFRLVFPGFEMHRALSDALGQTFRAYAFQDEDCRDWYRRFADDVIGAADEHRFLPVYRMSDGEFGFAVGPLHDLLPLHRLRPRQIARRIVNFVTRRRGQHRSGAKGYGWEVYTSAQRRALLDRYVADISTIAGQGYLGISLDETPLFSPFIPYLLDWYDRHGVHLHAGNYTHMYAVYVLMNGPDRERLLRGRSVLVVNHHDEARKRAIAAALARAGVAKSQFINISRDKALHERIDLSAVEQPVDLALVGAGVGASNIIVQLAPLNVPSLDVGWSLDLMANPELRWDRPYCVPDSELDLERIRFIPEDERLRATQALAGARAAA